MSGTKPQRVPELDGLRGLAILLVLIWHYGLAVLKIPIGLFAGPLILILNLAWSGVDLFFVLSGFLIGGILLDNREAPYYFKAFYTRRIFRIFPLYFMWLAIFALVVLLALPSAPATPAAWLWGSPLPWWSYVTFTQNFVMSSIGALWPQLAGHHVVAGDRRTILLVAALHDPPHLTALAAARAHRLYCGRASLALHPISRGALS